MLDRHRIAFLALTIVGFAFAISSLSSVLADPPSATESRIREALKGNVDGDSSADGILSGVIDVIKQRGSVLDGTVLDDREPEHGGADAGQSARSHTDSESDSAITAATASDRALVAEQLLRASRMLESIGANDRGRDRLIRQMRREAAKLLSE